jgi:hypothetical protein
MNTNARIGMTTSSNMEYNFFCQHPEVENFMTNLSKEVQNMSHTALECADANYRLILSELSGIDISANHSSKEVRDYSRQISRIFTSLKSHPKKYLDQLNVAMNLFSCSRVLENEAFISLLKPESNRKDKYSRKKKDSVDRINCAINKAICDKEEMLLLNDIRDEGSNLFSQIPSDVWSADIMNYVNTLIKGRLDTSIHVT